MQEPEDSVVERYYARATGGPTVLDRLLRRRPAALPYLHLMLHSDAEGYCPPQEFPSVLFPADPQRIAGAMVGSAPRLLSECRAALVFC